LNIRRSKTIKQFQKSGKLLIDTKNVLLLYYNSKSAAIDLVIVFALNTVNEGRPHPRPLMETQYKNVKSGFDIPALNAGIARNKNIRYR